MAGFWSPLKKILGAAPFGGLPGFRTKKPGAAEGPAPAPGPSGPPSPPMVDPSGDIVLARAAALRQRKRAGSHYVQGGERRPTTQGVVAGASVTPRSLLGGGY